MPGEIIFLWSFVIRRSIIIEETAVIRVGRVVRGKQPSLATLLTYSLAPLTLELSLDD